MKPLEKHHLALPHAGWFLQTSPVCTKMIKFSAESMQYHTVSSSNRSWHAHPNMTPNDHQSLRHLLLKPLHLGKCSSITHVLGRQVGVAMLRSSGPSSNVCWLLLPQQQLGYLEIKWKSHIKHGWNLEHPPIIPSSMICPLFPPWMFSAMCRCPWRHPAHHGAAHFGDFHIFHGKAPMVKPVKAEMPNFTLRYRLVEWKAYATRLDAATGPR